MKKSWMIELMPVSCYRIIVYTETRLILNDRTDYAAISESLGNNWYLIERDWN